MSCNSKLAFTFSLAQYKLDIMRKGLGNLSGKAFFTFYQHTGKLCRLHVGVRLSYDSAQWNVNEGSSHEMSGNILDFH